MNSLAPDNPEVLDFEAEVETVDGRDVVLSETYFYAESGGQPADAGAIDGVDVVDVQDTAGRVVHTLAEDPDVEAGETVEAAVDAEFRTYCRRAHTASHALYGAGRRLLEDLGYGGFDIGSEKVRVDFTTTTDIDDAVLVELEREVNRVVWDALPVTWEYMDAQDARANEDIAFNTKTEEGVMSEAEEVRVVTIEGWDVAACGGTHVSNTIDIGPVRVLGRSNPGEGLTRVEFAVGPVGVDEAAQDRIAAMDAAREAGVGVRDLPDAVERLRDETEALETEVQELKSEVLEARLADLETVTTDGETWRLGTVDGFGPNEVGDRVEDLADEHGGVVAVAGESGDTFVVVASRGDTGAGAVVDRVTAEFGGGGGGGPAFAQGGGIQAGPGEVLAFLRE